MQPADKSLHLACILLQEADVVAAHDALGTVERDNPYEVRKQIPNLGIIGGLDVTVMGTGTPGQCVDMAKRAIDELGRDGGFWLGCNKFVTYENDMNSENLKAVSDFVMEYKG